LLPSNFANPFTREIIGVRQSRDPLAPPSLPAETRAALVGHCDAWELCVLCWSLVLPQRPEEFRGLLVSDVDPVRRELQFGTRLGCNDFNKAHQSFQITYPAQFDPIVRSLIGGRSAGPLLRRRRISPKQRAAAAMVSTQADVESAYDRFVSTAAADQVFSEQDRKALFREFLTSIGGLKEDEQATAFRKLSQSLSPAKPARFYDLRGSVSTDLRRAGVEEILRTCVTGRSLHRNIMAAYESQDLHNDMAKYFRDVAPLLDAIAARAIELGIDESPAEVCQCNPDVTG
jgi:hypothetical protein